MSIRAEAAEAPPERLSVRSVWIVLTLLLAAVAAIVGLQFLPSDKAAEAAAPAAEPAHVEAVAGSSVSKIRLSPDAARRLGIETVAVRKSGTGLLVPYSAVVYETNGKAWVYASREKLVFKREPIVVRRVAGGRALLSRGPVASTRIATVGVAELWGTEFGVGH